MKKFLILILTTLVFAVADAQIFTQKEIRDKFNDVVSKREIKTLITKNDTAIIIEEKGKEPVTYKVLFEFDSKGSEDNIVRLVDNVYGYEKSWIVVLDEYRCAITHRVVTDKYLNIIGFKKHLLMETMKEQFIAKIINFNFIC